MTKGRWLFYVTLFIIHLQTFLMFMTVGTKLAVLGIFALLAISDYQMHGSLWIALWILVALYILVWLMQFKLVLAAFVLDYPEWETKRFIKSSQYRPVMESEISPLYEALNAAVDVVGDKRAPLWLVDNNAKSPYSYGSEVFLPRTMLDSQHLPVIALIGLFSYTQGDGAFKIALDKAEKDVRIPLFNQWQKYWRQQIFQVDSQIIKVGYGDQLRAYFEEIKPYTHEEYVAERLERLLA